MRKDKIYKIIFIGGMIVSFILIIWDFTGDSKYKLGNIFSHIGVFVLIAYLFHLYTKNKRRREKQRLE